MRTKRRRTLAIAAALLATGCGPSAAAVPTTPSTVPSTPASSAPTPPSAAPSPAPLRTSSIPAAIEVGRILFSIERDGSTTDLVYLDATGLHTIAMPRDPSLAHAVWAGPDDIVFDSERLGNRHVYRMSQSGDQVAKLTGRAETAEERPAVSPDGSLVAFDQFEPAANRDLGLQEIGLDGMNQVGLTPAAQVGVEGGDTEPAYSPDGRSIVFTRVTDWEGGGAALFVLDIGGGEARRLTTDAIDAGSPRWSPDGDWILFTPGYHGGESDGLLRIVSVDGGEPQPFGAPDAGLALEGDWSPDGRFVVYKYWEPTWDHNELRVMRVGREGVTTVWVGGAGEFAETPDWGP